MWNLQEGKVAVKKKFVKHNHKNILHVSINVLKYSLEVFFEKKILFKFEISIYHHRLKYPT